MDEPTQYAIHVEAMRLARDAIKNKLREAHCPISHYSALEISKSAKLYLEAHPELLDTSRDNLIRHTCA